MDKILQIVQLIEAIKGYKTYIAAVGLIGLGVYQASQGDFPSAFQSLMGGLAAFGVRSALKDNEQKMLLHLKKKD